MSRPNGRRIARLEAHHRTRKLTVREILAEARQFELRMQQRADAGLPPLQVVPDLSTGIGRMLAQALAWEGQKAAGSSGVNLDCEAWRQQREAPTDKHRRPL